MLAGVPLAICASADNLNLSPLYGHPGVPFVCSGRELAAVLAAARPGPLEALPRPQLRGADLRLRGVCTALWGSDEYIDNNTMS